MVYFELIYLFVGSSTRNTSPTMYIAIVALIAVAATAAVAVLHHRRRMAVTEPRPGPEEIAREEEHEG